jgi:hypothetical protein
VLETCTIKNALRFLSRESYLVFEVFDESERHLFDLSQNEFFDLFSKADSPYETLGKLRENAHRKNK